MHSASEAHPARGLDIAALVAACLRETARWRREGASDSRFCLEIFRRALLRQGAAFLDEPAREALVQIYSDHIRANISRKALPGHADDDLVQQAWLRFWQAASNGSLEFLSLEAALGYLRLTTVSTVIEARRQALRRQRELALADLADGADGADTAGAAALSDAQADAPFEALQRARFRERCRELLDDPLTYYVFWLRYSMGYPPREIAAKLDAMGIRLRGRGPTARAVSDLIERAIQRLAADQEIRDLLQGD